MVSSGRCRSEYGKYFPGEVASRAGTGERWTGTPFAVLLNPSANKVALF